MAKFARNANPAYKKAVLKAQYDRLTETDTKTLKQVQKEYINNMWPEDRELLFPKRKTKTKKLS